MKPKAKRSTIDNSSDRKEDTVNKQIKKEENGNINGSNSTAKKSDALQPTISTLFSKMQNKRKLQEDNVDHSKKSKLEDKVEQTKKSKLNGTSSPSNSNSKTATLPKKCSECRQLLDSPDLKLYPGDPDDAQEEFVMLTAPILSVHTDGEYDSVDVTERLQHRITNFSVYDRNTHLVPFDQGLIEKNVELYFSGYVKPIYEEDPSYTQGGIHARNLGPINEWYVSGFDGGSKALIGFGTAFAEYFLMSPSELYAPYMMAVQEKIYLSKVVIETLTENNEATYEDLLNKLENTVPPQGITKFSEDSLLRHAQFIVDQIQSYDSAADESDPILIVSPAIRAMIGLSGVTLGGKQRLRMPTRAKTAKVKKDVHSLATTTPLVRSIFENFFTGQLENDRKSNAPRRKRCGVCEVCQLPDCGKCNFCRDMVKFGGSGRGKQACAQRRCPNMAVQEANEDDILEDNLEDEMDKKALSSINGSSSKKSLAVAKAEVSWVEEPYEKTSSKKYYSQAKVNDFIVRLGDYVFVKPMDTSTPMFIARILLMFETSSGKKRYHALWFERGTDTVLGETSDPHEIFGTFDCDEKEMSCIHSKCYVIYKAPASNWKDLGGTEDSLFDTVDIMDEKSFFYQKWYDSETCRFEDPPEFHDTVSSFANNKSDCLGCKKEAENEQMTNVELDKLDEDDNKIYFKSAAWLGQTLKPGDCVFINPEAFSLPKKKTIKKENESDKEVDETMYPEAYRKRSDYIKGSNLDVPEPFKIGYIVQIFQKKKKDLPNVLVKAFYRSEDTCRSDALNHLADLNLLFWSDDEFTIGFSDIEGKCHVIFGENLTELPDEYASKGPYRFYFNESYDSSNKKFDEPPTIAQRMGRVGKGKALLKNKNNSNGELKEKKGEEYSTINHKLKTLDVFSGCGGLSEGFHEAGICDTRWAIEKEEPAAQAFRLNFPECSVFSEDCNLLLRLVMDGQETAYKGQNLPQKGEVEMICGGPPCQGFSGMNRFNSRQYSLFKNSLVVSYLSYCDYYRPRFFLLENVRNFVSFKRSMILKLTLRTLIRMGYQCTFAVLQAGQYGVPQTRRRAIILAAAPGEKLPLFPEPQYVFSPRACQLTVVVDDKKVKSNIRWHSSAPYRTITVGDSMSDLPNIRNGAKAEEISYNGEPISHFQRKLRGHIYQPTLRDHICKEMNPLVEARMKYIPTVPGADWRDLPNISVRLNDGTFTKLLKYTHDDVKNGKASNGALRGVCACASGLPCDPMDRQFGTLIPWCLPHTGNRHNNWSGLYGRLEWDGFFSTTITNPEPMGKQGRVLHPKQNRLVSVRECARSQGFPDSYRFFGTILDRHRQIGNAVPPPLATAIGLEIKKSLAYKETLTTDQNTKKL